MVPKASVMQVRQLVVTQYCTYIRCKYLLVLFLYLAYFVPSSYNATLLFFQLANAMFMMGCDLEWEVIKTHLRRPKAPLIALFSQFTFMPLVCIYYPLTLVVFPSFSKVLSCCRFLCCYVFDFLCDFSAEAKI